MLPRSMRSFQKGVKPFSRVQIENGDKSENGRVASLEGVAIHLNVKGKKILVLLRECAR